METNQKVEMLFYSTGSSVAVKVGWSGSYTFAIGTHRGIRRNFGEDRERYPMIISAHLIDDFMYRNDIKDEQVVVDPESVDQFYTFDADRPYSSVTLKPSFVDTWWNYDLPILYRCNPNKDGSTNMLGQPIPCFSFSLVESSFMGCHLDERLTEEEALKLTKGREHTQLYREAMALLAVQSDHEIHEMEKRVKRYDERVQALIDRHHDEIVGQLAGRFKGTLMVDEKGKGYPVIPQNFGFDCGFMYIYTTDQSYKETRRSLKHHSSDYSSDHMNISLPYTSQSLTVMREQFDIVKSIVQQELGVELWQKSILD